MPSTLRPSLSTPAMFSSEPLGFASARDLARRRRVAEGDAVVALQRRQRRSVAEVVALHVADGHAQHLPARQAVR